MSKCMECGCETTNWFYCDDCARKLSNETININKIDAPIREYKQGIIEITSNTCRRCGRALSDPKSIKRGYGPMCYGKVKIQTTIETNLEEVFFDIVITEEEAKPFRDQFTKRNECSCGFKGIHKEPILGYWDHPGGWMIRGRMAWLYIHCPKCGYEWSIWKLGVLREPTLDGFNNLVVEEF
ncbi:MAG: DUF6011 domain-containing protein [Promethearchaeota archaeon]